MNSPDSQSPGRSLLLSAAFIAVGLAGLGLSFLDAGSGFAARNDPGPWLLPRVLSLGLVAGGILLLVLGRRKVHSLEPASETVPVAGRPVLELLGGAVAYIALLPWAGFL
ncbi:MAG TPA: tripartite tricarboxylate transporter TctB family protein, partial [Verrucomicrobiae bacterium]|nr:tripartite tricarboxylate transporter TctB family protein [Verrucomicrobiae bacterium]